MNINKWISEYRSLANEYSNYERKVKTSEVLDTVMKVIYIQLFFIQIIQCIEMKNTKCK